MQADHSSFGGAVRLCKRWVSSQLLSGHLPHVAVELLVAHLYLAPAPYTPPHTPHVAFLRFLHLLAHTDWKTTPFLVNLNDAFTGNIVFHALIFYEVCMQYVPSPNKLSAWLPRCGWETNETTGAILLHGWYWWQSAAP